MTTEILLLCADEMEVLRRCVREDVQLHVAGSLPNCMQIREELEMHGMHQINSNDKIHIFYNEVVED